MDPQDRLPQTLAKGRFLHLFDDNGWEYVKRPRGSSVVAVASLTTSNHLLFVEQYRPALKSRTIEIPAGLVGDTAEHERESIFDAAKRELLEETGFKVGTLKLLCSGPSSSGMTNEMVHILEALGCEKVGAALGDGQEEISPHEIPLGDAVSWIKEKEAQGFIIDLKVFMALWHFDAGWLRGAVS